MKKLRMSTHCDNCEQYARPQLNTSPHLVLITFTPYSYSQCGNDKKKLNVVTF